jgi:hypothetical protein
MHLSLTVILAYTTKKHMAESEDEAVNDFFSAEAFSIFGKLSSEDFAKNFKHLVNDDLTGLRIKGRSRKPIPLFGTSDGNECASQRLEHTWNKKAEVVELYDNDELFRQEGVRRVETQQHNSILLHTSGFFSVKVQHACIHPVIPVFFANFCPRDPFCRGCR